MPPFDWLVLLIPVISALVGWGTNLIAVRMMFHPLEFVGIKPFLGWQGIVPANARSFAGKATELITSKLINLRTALETFDPAAFTEGNLGKALDEMTEQSFERIKARSPSWESTAPAAQDQIKKMLRREVSQVAAKTLGQVSEQIDDLIDVKLLVMDAATRDRAMMGDLFMRIGSKEFSFIRISGLYFGALFGLVQMGTWLFAPFWWVLPLFGFFVGYATNWLALKLIFEPAEEKQFGPVRFQGLFHKRQQEVAQQFATLISGEVINPSNMLAHMMEGKRKVLLLSIIEREVDDFLERYRAMPFMQAIVPDSEWPALREEVLAQTREEATRPGGLLETFVGLAIDVYGSLFEKMSQLDSKSFEGVLRPSFQKDEWKLILAGGFLGLGAGVLQLVYIFGDTLG